MFNEWIMRSKTLNQAFENITSGFVNYLPFERCALFAYSSTDQSGFGLYGYQLNNEEIKNINENIDGLPLIKNYIQRLQLLGGHIKNLPPIYVSEASEGLPIKYVKQFQLESIVIAPIYVPSESKLIGAAILDQGPGKPFKISNEIFTTVMKFGQSAGEILAKFGGGRPKFPKASETSHLSPREIEVLKLVAEGASTYEAAKKLHLSEYTVRDYVSTVLQKLNAKNRTEAIVKAIRDGII
ncbi:helix-turn-helix transcriptional regulator [Parageobacillus thermoglucosidasius]|uniref:helix-turn-helix transcriptional regulator n=1 Tax=Parageobacillus thermoglucosidasius TaxID=1426 RepID=UPI0021192CE6|nr:response regulator transcription factor [Parageobacillus thermoglucosidasius]